MESFVMLTGSCLCGSVAYEVEAPAGPIVHCHCTTCRKTPWGRVFYGHAGAPGGFSLAARRRAVVELRIVAREASAVLHQMRLAYRRRSAEPAKRAAAAGVSRHADHRPAEAAHVAVRGCELVRPGRRPGRISQGPVLTGGEQCHAKSTCLPFTRAALRNVPSNLKPNRRAAFKERVRVF